MKRFFLALCVALIGVLVFVCGVFAAWEYYFPSTVVETASSARTYYPVTLGYGGDALVSSGKINANGLDTNMQIGTTNIEYMMSGDQVATVIPNLPSGGQVECDLYTGYTPNQTAFPLIAGDNGRFETADAAAIELGNNFEIEIDGYLHMDDVHYPLVYKQGSFLIDISAAGTITAGCINADSYDVTPIVFAAWTDVDVSNYIPSGATGVVVEIDCPATKATGVRENGSTDDRRTDTEHTWAMIGVDDNEIFEVYLEDNTCHVYLRGYTDDNWVYNTNATDISMVAVGAWTDVDISAYVPDGAVGAIIEVVNTDGAAARDNGVRKNGSTDNRHPDIAIDSHVFRLVGLDDSQIFEGYIEHVNVDYYLIGYVTNGATFATNGTDKSLGGAGAWTNVDCSTEAPDATYLFFEVVSTGAVNGIGFREDGSTDNIITGMTRDQIQGITKCDMAQVCEAYEANIATTDFYLIGYTEYGIYPAYPDPTYLVSVSVGGGAIPSGEHNVVVQGTGGGGNLVVNVDAGTWTGNAAIGAGVTNTTNNWRFMSLAIPYMDDYYHTVGGVLQITYEPNTMLTGSTVEDRTNAFDGTIAWGDNQNVSVVHGEIESYEDTDAVASGVGGFDMPESPMPSTWFGDASNIANLPAYDSFNNVATQMGMPTQTLYFWAIIGLAFGCCLFVVVFTRSALFGVMAMTVVLFIGSSQTIIPMWIPFCILVVDIAIMYLYRQVSY